MNPKALKAALTAQANAQLKAVESFEMGYRKLAAAALARGATDEAAGWNAIADGCFAQQEGLDAVKRALSSFTMSVEVEL